jgi:hypothetical protein
VSSPHLSARGSGKTDSFGPHSHYTMSSSRKKLEVEPMIGDEPYTMSAANLSEEHTAYKLLRESGTSCSKTSKDLRILPEKVASRIPVQVRRESIECLSSAQSTDSAASAALSFAMRGMIPSSILFTSTTYAGASHIVCCEEWDGN